MDKLRPYCRAWLPAPNSAIEVQIFDWVQCDEPLSAHEPWQSVIRGFGVTRAGESICVVVTGFRPSFYVKLPDDCTLSTFHTELQKTLNTLGSHNKALSGLDVLQCTIERHKDLYGFHGTKQFAFGKIVFTRRNIMYKVRQQLQADHPSWLQFESNVDPVIQFTHTVKFVSWIRLPPGSYSALQTYSYSSCQLAVRVAADDVVCFDCDDNARFLQMSYDIETNSSTGDFPDATNAADVVYQIACTFKWFGESEVWLQLVFVIGPCDPIDGAIVVSCEDEAELLRSWAIAVHGIDPDIIYSYNGFGFDDAYVVQRILHNSLKESVFENLSRLASAPATLEKTSFSSSARGTSSFQYLSMPGRFNFDLLVYIRSEFKLEFYKLDYVAEQFLGQHKNPVTPHMIFEAYRAQDPAKTAEVARYCIQDTLLPQRISDKKEILTSMIEMSRATYVKLNDLLLKGQQVKVLSQILKFAHASGYLVPTIDKFHKTAMQMNSIMGGGPDEDDDANGAESKRSKKKNFQGASVLEPITGRLVYWTE